jgi:molybdate/tungstate transport system ATP-binding protein
MIQLDQLSVKLPGFRLHPISLTVEQGEFFVLLGPTGSGKTVILESIAGLVRISGGQVRVDGQDLTHLPPEQRQIGIVYQDNALFPHLTVMENIRYGLRYVRQDPKQADERVGHLIELLGLRHLVRRRPLNLSGGEKQRVCLARALSIHPSVLLLDEPLSALDPNFREDIRRVLKQLHSEFGITFMMVTHDFNEALYLADRIGIIRQGSMEQIGSAEDVFLRPDNPFVAEFVGMKNMFSGCIADGAFVFDGLHYPLPQQPVQPWTVLAVRPEDILLRRDPGFAGNIVHYPGVIEQIMPTGLGHEVGVRCLDARFRALLDRRTLQEQGFGEGDRVYLGFEAEVARLF